MNFFFLPEIYFNKFQKSISLWIIENQEKNNIINNYKEWFGSVTVIDTENWIGELNTNSRQVRYVYFHFHFHF